MYTTICTAEDCAIPTAGGRTLCNSCAVKLHHLIAETPALREELVTTYTRQDRIGSPTRNAPGNHTPLTYNTRAAEALDVLDNVLHAWADTLAPDHHNRNPLATLARLAALLVCHPEAGQALDELADAHHLGWEAIDRPGPTVHLGQCGTKTFNGPCYEHLYARPGDTHVQCRNCHTDHHVHTRRQTMLAQLQNQVVTQSAALSWLHTLTDRAIPPATFRSWVARRKIQPIDHNTNGKPLYRFGDIHQLITR